MARNKNQSQEGLNDNRRSGLEDSRANGTSSQPQERSEDTQR